MASADERADGSGRCETVKSLHGVLLNNAPIGSDDHDFHGNTIVGGTTKTVAEGDIVSAPHGTAHQMDPGDGHILYIVIKIIRKP